MIPYSSGIIITINLVKFTISSDLFDEIGCGFTVNNNFGTPTKKIVLDTRVVDTENDVMTTLEAINSNR